MSVSPSERYPNDTEALNTVPLEISEKHRESLERTQQIASAVGSELTVRMVESVNSISPEPGVYVFRQNDGANYESILQTKFTLEPEVLSGKVDSAHAVLPGELSIICSQKGTWAEKHFPVAAKGYYKRELADRFSRVATEVGISQLQASSDELAFEPIAVVIAPPEYAGKGTDNDNYDLLLVTKLDRSAVSLDNAPWQLGFNEANVKLAHSALAALGRFNSTVGMHGDAKIKNVAQHPDGLTSMIDFETTQGMQWDSTLGISTTVHEDLGKMFGSLADAGFFKDEPYKAREILDELSQTYLEQWQEYPSEVQDAVSQQVVNVIEATVPQVDTSVPAAA